GGAYRRSDRARWRDGRRHAHGADRWLNDPELESRAVRWCGTMSKESGGGGMTYELSHIVEHSGLDLSGLRDTGDRREARAPVLLGHVSAAGYSIRRPCAHSCSTNGSMSAPFGQTIVPSSGSTRTWRKTAGSRKGSNTPANETCSAKSTSPEV